MSTEKIGAEGTEPEGAPRRTGDAHAQELDEQLDAALACTFPASDPIGGLGTYVNCRPDRPEHKRATAAGAS